MRGEDGSLVLSTSSPPRFVWFRVLDFSPSISFPVCGKPGGLFVFEGPPDKAPFAEANLFLSAGEEATPSLLQQLSEMEGRGVEGVPLPLLGRRQAQLPSFVPAGVLGDAVTNARERKQKKQNERSYLEGSCEAPGAQTLRKGNRTYEDN